jgi:2-polyprenyl-3-methyl-5-hydroxy-6-metoxy-1,4-benzoquinol methylase
MPNLAILAAIAEGRSKEPAKGKSALDLGCASGETAQLLAGLGYRVIATEYGIPPLIDGIDPVGGVDLNSLLPFKKDSFDAVDIIEVIAHIENQPLLVHGIFARACAPPLITRANRGKRPVFICCTFTSSITCSFIMVLKLPS